MSCEYFAGNCDECNIGCCCPDIVMKKKHWRVIYCQK